MSGFPGAIPRPSPNFRANRRGSIDLVVLHTTEDTSLQGSLDTLTDEYRVDSSGEGARVSAHYLVDDSGVYQLVDDDDESWAALNWNPTAINVEVVGRSDTPLTWSAPKVRNLGHLVGWLSREYAIPLQYRAKGEPAMPRGIVAHGALDPANRYDPGIWFPWPEVRNFARDTDPGPETWENWAPLIAVFLVALGLVVIR